MGSVHCLSGLLSTANGRSGGEVRCHGMSSTQDIMDRDKMLSFSVPRDRKRAASAKAGSVHGNHRSDLGRRSASATQMRTAHAKRIFDRLRDERFHGRLHPGRTTRGAGASVAEVFVPLSHSPGHAKRTSARRAYGRSTSLPSTFPTVKLLCCGSGGDDRSILRWPQRGVCLLRRRRHPVRNTKLAVARILGDGKRSERASSRSFSPTLFEAGSAIKGNDRARSRDWSASSGGTSWSPSRVPRASRPSTALDQCRRRQAARLRGFKETSERLERDRQVLLPLPPAPYDACDKRPGRASSLSGALPQQRLFRARGLRPP